MALQPATASTPVVESAALPTLRCLTATGVRLPVLCVDGTPDGSCATLMSMPTPPTQRQAPDRRLVRRAAEHEATFLTDLAIRSKAYWGYGGDFLDRARVELTVEAQDIRQGRVWAAEDERRVVGFYAHDLDARPPELTALFVEPVRIGRGFGKALLRDALARAAAAGVATLVIESEPNAEAFYEAHGAAREASRKSPSTGRTLPLLRIATSGGNRASRPRR